MAQADPPGGQGVFPVPAHGIDGPGGRPVRGAGGFHGDADALFRKGLLRRSRVSLCIYGAIATIVIYGGIMNPAAALIYTNTLNWQLLMTYYVSGIPVDLIHAVATVLFLWLAAEPMLEKLDRIKVKYGLMD